MLVRTQLCSVLFLIGISAVLSQVTGTGNCPAHPVVSNFDWRKFAGKWYEIERFFAIFEVGKKCVTSEYSELPGGDIRVVNRGINKWTKKDKLEIGRATHFHNEPAKFDVTFPTGIFFPKRLEIWVLDTDYSNYAVLWSCKKFLWFFHRQYAWILSKERTLTEDARIKLYEKLEELNVNTNKFYLTDQANCPDGH
uniref:Apolipoprotein D n=1 Tax=Strigamia maritima TaxID=126957 RepID=T1JDI5_STRMM